MPSLRPLRSTPEPLAPPGMAGRSWRVTTAFRVFVLALATGLLLGQSTAGRSAPLLVALMLVACAASLLEMGAPRPLVRWVPVGEVVLVAILLGSTPHQAGLSVYLAVPAVVAGVRHGLVTTINVAVTGVLVLLTTLALTAAEAEGAHLADSLTWLVVGLGMGALASWQTRSVRDLQAQQAPYAAAHQLLSQLHRLTQRGEVGLDVRSLAARLDADLRAVTGATRSAVVAGGTYVSPDLLAAHGDPVDLLRHACTDPAVVPPTMHVVPLLGADHRVGTAVLYRADGWTSNLRSGAAEVAGDHSVRLDTALLFDSVRVVATTEERNRIAREMHDGVAQEIAALGYVVDEIESTTDEPAIRTLSAGLRDEITRVVAELRFSIFDLRHDITDGHLASALAEYVREAGHRTDLHVHLTLDESGPSLPLRT
ncbi:histidine kinase, partial [Nocardioides sp. P5_C9_2]